jgi:hypothetical protein
LLMNLQVPSYSLNNTADRAYVSTAMRAAGVNNLVGDMPKFLKRGITFEEMLKKIAIAEEDDHRYVVWKSGRTTHFTFGILSGIESDYRSFYGVVSDELLVKDYNKQGTYYSFSRGGDSGSFVWDSEGYVAGMLWGGKYQNFVTYVTPIEYVLEDIRLVCNAKEVRLVVRKKDETDVVFGLSGGRSNTGAGVVLENSTSSGTSLFDEDAEGVSVAESDCGL